MSSPQFQPGLVNDGEALRARRILNGTLPGPVVSSSCIGWRSIALDVFETSGFDVLLQPTCHVVSVQMRGCSRLVQCRDGRSCTRSLAAGDVIVTPTGAPKRWQCNDKRAWISLRIDPNVLRNAVQHCGVDAERLELIDNFGTRDPVIADLARRLLSELQAPNLASDMYVQSLAYQLIVHLVRHHSTAQVRAPEAQPLTRHKLRRAEDFIEANLAEPLTLDSIANALSMSPFHFAHVFQRATGKSPHHFVVERRIDRAKSLLETTDLPIMEVAHQVGCRSQAHFATLFRRQTGLAPSEYRRQADSRISRRTHVLRV